jgi:hypothetical protein
MCGRLLREKAGMWIWGVMLCEDQMDVRRKSSFRVLMVTQGNVVPD